MSKKSKDNRVSLKAVIVGNQSVGKSTLLIRHVDNIFNPQVPTIGLDFRLKKMERDGVNFDF